MGGGLIYIPHTSRSFRRPGELVAGGLIYVHQSLKSKGNTWFPLSFLYKNGSRSSLRSGRGFNLGLGSETFQKLIDGRITPERIKNASKYEDGMENLLFLSEIQKNCQIAITSILPELYIKKLGMIPVDGIKKSMDYILKNQGPRQKVQVIEDGARTLLREN